MADSQIEEIKNKLNVLDVIGGYVKLTKTGINYRGVCPFHTEKSPSFFVSPTRQMWHCFGCGKGSSIFDFVMAIEGVEFPDALRILAQKAGVELKRENPQLRTERARLHEILDLACKFFEKQTESGVGKEAEDYLIDRGITKESVKKWRVGYSPDTWNSLTDFLIGKGYKREEIVKAGLAIQKEDNKGDSYDRFRGRIMFPIFDLNSAVVGFGGRIFKQQNETAKYINTPQTILYDKSNVLYGLNNAKLTVRKLNQCVVTEGYTDVIMCHQAGFENTVASSGTALTMQHLNILKRYSENLVLAFDMDVAGDSATKRGINLAQEQGFNIKIIESYGNLKEKADPADVIKKDPKIWQESLANAKIIMDYYFDSAFLKFDKVTPEGKKEIGKVVLPAIKRLQNKIEQSHWVQKLAQMLGVTEDVILEELAKIKADVAVSGSDSVENEPKSEEKSSSIEGRRKIIEEKVASLILKNPDYVKLIGKDEMPLFSEKIKSFFESLLRVIDLPENQLEAQENKKDFKKMFESASGDDSDFKNFIAALALKGDAAYEENREEEMQLCLLQLKNIELKDKLNKISNNIKMAESSGDNNRVKELVDEFNKLTKQL